MNSLTRIMSYDKTKIENQENNVKCKTNNKRTIEYSPLSEEEIECIISKRYSDKDEKTKTFIKKALKKQGDKYDYFDTVYIKNKKKVIITCRVKGHGNFLQTPDCHLRKYGCSLCSGTKKLTTEEFINRANKVHGIGRYDYSKAKYKNTDTKVCIICHNHVKPFEFWQTPHDHLNKKGCIICSKHKKLTLEEFINKSIKIHGNKYDYSKVIYKNNRTKICIICNNHKQPFEFWQTPNSHLNKIGCPKCKSSKGEIMIRNFLIKNKIEFEEQKRFKDCRDINPLPFDFYLPQYNLCIEFDGKQHFILTKFKSSMSDEQMKENLKICQFHDKLKNEYCKNNNIFLLRLNNINNVEEKLIEYFKIMKS